MISPHSDDLYENVITDFLSLTVCRDLTTTPTRCYFPKDLLKNFNDDELKELLAMKAVYISGKNVQGPPIRKVRPIVEYEEEFGFVFNFDFRVDKITGERMAAFNPSQQYLIDKLRKDVEECPFETSLTKTGTFFILANRKVMHARAPVDIDKACAPTSKSLESPLTAPRLLYRSKGSRVSFSFEHITAMTL